MQRFPSRPMERVLAVVAASAALALVVVWRRSCRRISIAEIAASIQWPDDEPLAGRTSFIWLDRAFGHMLPLQAQRVIMHDGPLPSCVEAVRDMQANALTTVLATVKVSGWKATWASNVVALVLTNFATTHKLLLHALKGGASCEGEIQFVCALMKALGFHEGYPDAPHKKERSDCTWYLWTMPRRTPMFAAGRAEPYQISLYVWNTPESLDRARLRINLHPYERDATSPNLRRMAIISSPVTDLRGERADEKLNKALEEVLMTVLHEDAPRGFRTFTAGSGQDRWGLDVRRGRSKG